MARRVLITEVNGVLGKVCPNPECLMWKPLEEGYYRRSRGPTGYASHCKCCCTLRAKLRREANPESSRAAVRRYRAAHPERVAEQHRRWRAANPEKAAEHDRRYRANHKGGSGYETPEKIRERARRRREHSRIALAFLKDHGIDLKELENTYADA